jgi:hypothetical protein
MRDTDQDAVQSPRDLPPPPPGFRRAPSGGLLRAPWPRGQSGNPSGYGTIAEYHRTVALARQHSTQAIQTLIDHMDHEDPRIALVAAQAVLERAWGKPREVDLNEVRERMTIDLSALSQAELVLLMKIAKSGALRPAEPETSAGTMRDAD